MGRAETPEEIARLRAVLEAARSFAVVNLGCKVNRVESDSIAAALAGRGAQAADAADADLVVVNTCTVTGEADKKTRKAVRHALRVSRRSPVVVTGCAVAVDPGTFTAMDPRVIACDRIRLMELVTQLAPAPTVRVGEGFRTRVNIKVQDGCDHACTYCIVHTARGRARSVPRPLVLEEAGRYLAAGAKEIVLTGIDLGSYRDGGYGLANLAGELLDLAASQAPAGQVPARIRSSSLEPMSISDDFVGLLESSEGRLCRHVHLPLQSGSTKVLREMARPYTAEDFADLVAGLYARVPQLSLTTDIIVGFPGESDEDFAETMELARACRFSKIHVFPYSKRAGTPAAARADQVDPRVAARRAAELRALSDELRRQDYERRIGMVEYAIVETKSAISESYHEIPVPEGAPAGSLVPVRLI